MKAIVKGTVIMTFPHAGHFLIHTHIKIIPMGRANTKSKTVIMVLVLSDIPDCCWMIGTV
jgi:hypothetical protein